MVLAFLPACAGQGGQVAPIRLPAVEVKASGETQPVGTVNQDAADDPAIWRNAANPAASLIVGTDKKAGLYVYGLDGKIRNFVGAGQLNNVDLIGGQEEALVVASDRTDRKNSKLTLFSLRFDDAKLRELGSISSGAGEAYGLCLQQQGRKGQPAVPATLTAYAAIKDGSVREVILTRGADGRYAGRINRSWKLPTQIEGCVTSGRNGDLFVGEENVGIWRIRTSQADAQPEKFASVGEAGGLVADVEGLAYAMNDNGRDYLIASSQGDSAYAVYDVDSGALLGRFRISDGTVDGVSETDGIELALGDFGPEYPAGLFIAQDGNNPGGAQNFKLVDWRVVLQALNLPQR
ncbi:MAG: phytase [Sphingobium sp.]|nr:phytase [Sphingobium sp.]